MDFSSRKFQEAVGARIRRARRDRGFTLAQLGALTGDSISALSRLESANATPTFAQVCAIASATQWPLYYFATGRGRAANDPEDVIAQLVAYGLRDLHAARSPLIGETRPFVEVLAAAVDLEPRVIEGLPALMLGVGFDVDRLVVAARSMDGPFIRLRRLAWLASVAVKIAPDVNAPVAPGAIARSQELQRRVASLADVDWTWDFLGRRGEILSAAAQAAEIEKTTVLARRWKIAYRTTAAQFIERAAAILTDPQND